MKEKRRVEKHRLQSGSPCLKHNCALCCFETEMPLSPLDIKKILKRGHKIDEFAVKTKDGWQLKNCSGRCVFLAENRCRIYDYRPEGCRLYPLVFDENLGKPVMDKICPYNHEFDVRKEDIQKLERLLAELQEKQSCFT